jgi:transcriptional regulator with GAF, ATPase, and Fis domain
VHLGPALEAVHHRQLRRHSREPGRIHPVRPREGFVHRRHRQRHIGKFQEKRDGGTLFLDEVGELPPDISGQAAARDLQEGEVEPVGAEKRTVKVDFRLISATNRSLLDQADQGRQASARISTTASTSSPYWVPPLRERKE